MIIRILVAVILSALAVAQTQPALSLPEGVRLSVSADKDIKLDRVTPGAEVRLHTTAALLGPNHAVVIPKDALIIGHVQIAEKHDKTAPSRLRVFFERAEWRDGSTTLSAFIDSAISLPPVPSRQVPPPEPTVILKPDFEPATAPDIGTTLTLMKRDLNIPGGAIFTIRQMFKPYVPPAPPKA